MDRKTLIVPLKKKCEEGFVLVAALMVIFLIVAIVSTVAAVTAADLKASARARAMIKIRFVAESVSDSIYASIAREKKDFVETANKNFVITAGGNSVDNNPLFSSADDLTNPKYGNKWFHISDDGSLELCDESNLKQICFVARMSQSGGTFADPIEQDTLDVIARGGCSKISGTPKNCIYRNFQQVLRTRTYVDEVQISESETTPLTGTNPVAYIPSDEIKGTIVSNDISGFHYCGDARDTKTLKSNSPTINRTIGVCDSDPDFAPTAALSDLKFLPGQIDNSGANKTTSSENVVFKALSGEVNKYNIFGDTKIELMAEKIKFTTGGITQELFYPSNGVIYIDGTADISGSYSRALSIYATKDITISGNILKLEDDGVTTFPDLANPATAYDAIPGENDKRILGIATSKNIILQCRNDGWTGACPDRHVVAVLNAPNGQVFNNNWDTASVGGGTPRFILYGSVISYYHPVFGSYFATGGDGTLEHGWAKSLIYDGRLRFIQPPYFFRTTQANVVRGTLEESPCDDTDVYLGVTGNKICVS